MLTLRTAAAVEDADAADAALAARGDSVAFERLYRGHVERIHSLAWRMAGGDAAVELTQDVFVRAWEKLGTFGGRAAFGSWLYRLAINVILTHRRQRTSRDGPLVDGDGQWDRLAARPVSPELAMDFEAAMAELPEGARRVVVLHDVEGYKHEEIAEMLGVAVGTSKSQLHRGRMMLRAYLSDGEG